MRNIILCGLLLLTSALYTSSQTVPTQDNPAKVTASERQTAADASTPGVLPPKATPTPERSPQIGTPSVASTYVRPDAKKRFNRYVNSMFGPMSLAKRAASSGFATWTNSPEEWGDSWNGFGKRFAWATAGAVVKGTTMYGLEEAFKLDSHFYHSKRRDVGSKVSNALLSTVTARNEDGKRVFGYPRIVGTYTGTMVAAYAWLPGDRNWRSALTSGSISLGFNAGFNLVKEFFKK